METQTKIMVVDDELGICKNVEKILTKNNYNVVHTQSAAKALEMMKKESFSLLISDIVMPEMNGLELLRHVAKEAPDTKAVMMTGYASTNTAVKAIRLGALDYIPKPFTPDELRTTVSKALEGELVKTTITDEEREAIQVMDIDIDFGSDAASNLVKQDAEIFLDQETEAAEVMDVDIDFGSETVLDEAVETSEFHCSVGDMVCDVMEKLGTTCKTGLKKNYCPKLKAREKKKAKKASSFNPKTMIGIDQPFDYDEVIAVTGPEYVQNMDRDGFAFLPYEELKKVSPVKVETERKEPPVDQPFDYDEVGEVTGPEYVQNMDRDGYAVLPYDEMKKVSPVKEETESKESPDLVDEPELKNILVVDDEVSVNNNIRKILGKNGFQVDQAVTKGEAIEKINQQSYKLVLLDLRIPGVSGLELLRVISETQPSARVIIITGYASIETAIETARIGAVDYLPKPFTPDELRNVAERAYAIAA